MECITCVESEFIEVFSQILDSTISNADFIELVSPLTNIPEPTAGHYYSVWYNNLLSSLWRSSYFKDSLSESLNLSSDYKAACLYAMFGPERSDSTYDSYYNKLVPGDFVATRSLGLAKLLKVSQKSNKGSCKVLDLKSNKIKYVPRLDLIKYNVDYNTLLQE